MSFQPARVRNLDAAQNQFSSLHETMNVVADAATNHGANDESRMRNDERNPNDECQNPLRTADATARRHWATFSFRALGFVINSSFELRHYSLRSIMPLDATMLYFSFMCSSGRRSTVPPAFSIRSEPAAISHKLIPVSMYASKRPHAT